MVKRQTWKDRLCWWTILADYNRLRPWDKKCYSYQGNLSHQNWRSPASLALYMGQWAPSTVYNHQHDGTCTHNIGHFNLWSALLEMRSRRHSMGTWTLKAYSSRTSSLEKSSRCKPPHPVRFDANWVRSEVYHLCCIEHYPD